MTGSDSNLARATLAKVNWAKRKDVATMHGHRIYLHDALTTLGMFYVDHTAVTVKSYSENLPDEYVGIVVMSPDTFTTLSLDPAVLDGIMTRLTQGANGLRYIDLMAAPYASTLRQRAKEAGVSHVVPRDTLDDLATRAETLLVKASSLYELGLIPGVANITRQLFFEERNALVADVALAFERLHRLEAVLSLATDAVYDAA